MATRKNSTSVGLSIETRDLISTESLVLSAEVGRRISIGELIRAAFIVAKRHRAELVTELKGSKSEQAE